MGKGRRFKGGSGGGRDQKKQKRGNEDYNNNSTERSEENNENENSKSNLYGYKGLVFQNELFEEYYKVSFALTFINEPRELNYLSKIGICLFSSSFDLSDSYSTLILL